MVFPTPFPTVLTPDANMQAALHGAIADAQLNFPSLPVPLHSAISIAAIQEPLDPDGSPLPHQYLYAGQRDREVHFSASLLKVAAMYAAYQLRQQVNEFSQTPGTSSNPNQLFADLHASFDPAIIAAVPRINAETGITPAMKVPKYQKVFAAVPLIGGGLGLEFSGAFLTNLRQMIVDSNNSAAGACVQVLGYSWINGALQAGGFFDKASMTGIWLAGTFVGAFPPVRIPSVNDGPSAQAMTSFDMTNLYALAEQGTLRGSQEMLDLLKEAQQGGPDPSFLTRDFQPPRSFEVTHVKIGLGPLNSGGDTASEAAILRHDSGARFIAVWQNTSNINDRLKAISHIYDKAIRLFLGLP